MKTNNNSSYLSLHDNGSTEKEYTVELKITDTITAKNEYAARAKFKKRHSVIDMSCSTKITVKPIT